MFISHKIKLYPTLDQKEYFEKSFGSNRHCYNQLLAYYKQPSIKWNKKDANARYKELRVSYPWYSEVSQRITRTAVEDLDNGFKNFFRRVKQGKNPGFPKFKKKGVNESFSIRESEKFSVDNRWLKIEKLPTKIKLSQCVRWTGKNKQVTISKTPTGKYYASILVDTEDYNIKAGIGSVGVDLGIKNLAVLSTGEVIEANQPLKKSLKKLKKYQRKLSKKQKGSNRRAKTKLKVARVHEHIKNQRKDTLHTFTDYLTKTYEVICIESLDVKEMVKNRNLARAISDAGFGTFRQLLEYKAKLRGNTIVAIDRFFPSSKICNNCGNVKKDLKLSQRIYECEKCGISIDRDLNAAINVLKQGEDTFKPTLKRTQELCKASFAGNNVDGINNITFC